MRCCPAVGGKALFPLVRAIHPRNKRLAKLDPAGKSGKIAVGGAGVLLLLDVGRSVLAR